MPFGNLTADDIKRMNQYGMTPNPGGPSAPPTPGGPGSYTGGTDPRGYGGEGEIMGDNQVPYASINLPYFQQDRNRLSDLMAGQSPFASGDWSSLIDQLKNRANGVGPSLAQQQYQGAQQDSVNALSSMSRGSAGPEAARTAMMQQGKSGQGMAAGMATAGLQERMMAQQQLQQALGQRDTLNQGAYLNVLAQQLGLSGNQLRALQGDQQYNQAQHKIDADQSAAAAQAVASFLAGAGHMGGS